MTELTADAIKAKDLNVTVRTNVTVRAKVDRLLTFHNRPEHIVRVGATVILDGDPFVVTAIRPRWDKGAFLDFGGVVEANEVIATVERFEGMPK